MLCFSFHALLQGGTVAYAMLARLPEMNAKVSVVVHMAPVVFLEFLRAPVVKAMGTSRSDKVTPPLHTQQQDEMWDG
jgi:hypothetical protein